MISTTPPLARRDDMTTEAEPPLPVKCLLVDDRDENLLALSALLAGNEVELLTARSGTEALELLLAHDVALALLDVQMPEMDGFELAELMRGSERTRAVPIIFVTAGDHDRHRVFRGYDSGAVDFLHKPIEPRVLKNKAEVFFQLHRTRQRLAVQLAERTETLRFNETFSAVLGHDLRGPLSAMMMSAMVLGKRAETDAARAAAARIVSSGKRMSRMIDDMFDLARARLGGGIPVHPEPGDLASILGHVVDEQRAANPDARIEWQSAGDPSGRWDDGRLAQVAQNLIGNAIRHGKAGEPVAVALDAEAPRQVSWWVQNAGTIDADLLPVIFEPFRKGERHGKSGEGLGIGLYIVSQIVRAHGGTIGVESASGQTRFTVRLPRANAA